MGSGLYSWYRLDSLPLVVQSFIRSFISQDDRSAASIAASTTLSRHVAYKMDYLCAPLHSPCSLHWLLAAASGSAEWREVQRLTLQTQSLLMCTDAQHHCAHGAACCCCCCKACIVLAWQAVPHRAVHHRLSRNHWAKALGLVWVILALIYIGGLGLYATSGQPLNESFWEVRLVWDDLYGVFLALSGWADICSFLHAAHAGSCCVARLMACGR